MRQLVSATKKGAVCDTQLEARVNAQVEAIMDRYGLLMRLRDPARF